MDEQALSYAESCFRERTGYSLSDSGKHKLRRCLHAFSLGEVIEALDASFSHYGKYDSCGRMTKEGSSKVLDMMYPICRHKRSGDIDLGTDSIYYSAGILSNRFGFQKKQFLPRLRQAEQRGTDPKELKRIALSARNYRTWRIAMEQLIGIA